MADLVLTRHAASVKAHLDALPGAAATLMKNARSGAPSSLIYKIKGKMFAILSVRGAEFVIVKCDPHLAEALRAKFKGVGHRSHLDKRFWIAMDLDADVPLKEIKRLASGSYDLARASLPRTLQRELDVR